MKQTLRLQIAAAAVILCFALLPSLSQAQEAAKPIPYRSIVLRGENGQRLPLQSRVEWRPGEWIRVAEAEARLNQLERQANAAGDSLTDRTDAASTQEELEWQANELRNRDLRTIRAMSNAEVRANPPVSTSTSEEKANPNEMRAFGGPKVSEKVYRWNWKKSSGTSGIDIQGSATFRASTAMAELNAKVIANAKIQGKTIPLATLTYLSDAPAKGEGRTIGQLSVGGYDVWSRDKTGNFAEETLVSQSWPLWTQDKTKVEIRTSAWGIPIVARAGIEGTVDLSLKAAIRSLGAGLIVTPSIEARAYAEAGVDLLVVEFGIGGDLSLLRYEAPLACYGEARISKGRWAMKATIESNHAISAGAGRIYAYVKALGIKKKKTLVSWDTPFLWQGTLIKEEYWKFL